jgi:hypothetical protein
MKRLIHEILGEIWTWLGTWLKNHKHWNPDKEA